MQVDNDIDEIEINNEQNEMLDQIVRRNKTAVIGESLMTDERHFCGERGVLLEKRD